MPGTHAATTDPADLAHAGRELMWNLGSTSHVLMYALMVAAMVFFALGLRRRIRSWKRGKPESESFGDWGRRLGILLREALWQRQTRRRLLPGLFHSLVFYSFAALFVTTLIVMADMDFRIRIYHGTFYLAITLLADVAGVLLLLGLGIAAVRRYLARPAFLPENRPADVVILALLGVITLTGFLAEGARIAFHPHGDPWQRYSPVGSLVAGLLRGADPALGRGMHFAVWWIHALGTFTMIALVPHTKFFHMLSIPTNQLLAKLAPQGSLARVDIEALLTAEDAPEELVLGIAEPGHLTWKQRIDLDACVDCGRCDEVCPVHSVDQPLSPRSLIKDLERLCRLADARVSAAPASKRGAAGTPETAAEAEPKPEPKPESKPEPKPEPEVVRVIGAADTVFADPDFIWHCRTCHACQSICPAAIRHVDHFVELRRAQVLMEGQLPADGARALKTLEAQGNPFGAQAERLDLVAKLGIPIVGPGEETEILCWIGCATTFDPERHVVAEDLVAILKHVGVRFGHLGRDETCCGDPARVFGEENLFQTIAKQTAAALNERRFTTLLVTCPHGYNAFKNEYPQFGAHLPVVHHSELLARWIREGRLRLRQPVEATAVFHDPCYLGRYQGIVAPPRDALRAIPGLRLRECAQRGEESFCCGAGGGHFWMDLEVGAAERVNSRRVRDAAERGADTIAVACPMCQQMLVDGVKQTNLDERLRVRDIASLVRAAAGI